MLRRSTLLGAVLVAAQLGATPKPARADEAQVERADDLFRAAVSLLSKQRFEEACPLLERSYALDAAAGTLQNLALCREKTGELSRAYAHFRRLHEVALAARPKKADRIALAAAKVESLRARIAFVTLDPGPEGDAAGPLELRVDGALPPEAASGEGIPVDVGARAFEVRRGGAVVLAERRTVAAGERVALVVPATPPAPVEPTSTAPVIPNDGPPDARRPEPRGSLALPVALVAGGGAVLVSGLVLGGLAFDADARGTARCTDGSPGRAASDPPGASTGAEFDANGRCYADTTAYREANDLHGQARTFATLSTILVPVGAVATAAGVWLWLRRGGSSSAGVAVQGTGVRIWGTF